MDMWGSKNRRTSLQQQQNMARQQAFAKKRMEIYQQKAAQKQALVRAAEEKERLEKEAKDAALAEKERLEQEAALAEEADLAEKERLAEEAGLAEKERLAQEAVTEETSKNDGQKKGKKSKNSPTFT